MIFLRTVPCIASQYLLRPQSGPPAARTSDLGRARPTLPGRRDTYCRILVSVLETMTAEKEVGDQRK